MSELISKLSFLGYAFDIRNILLWIYTNHLWWIPHVVYSPSLYSYIQDIEFKGLWGIQQNDWLNFQHSYKFD